uniref:Uncharacterized protein n=1 Tax=viral metagenome TaxID=1070528 RepID=A0A6C0DNW2_9ZZZZ
MSRTVAELKNAVNVFCGSVGFENRRKKSCNVRYSIGGYILGRKDLCENCKN